jgi:hypothetical protein
MGIMKDKMQSYQESLNRIIEDYNKKCEAEIVRCLAENCYPPLIGKIKSYRLEIRGVEMIEINHENGYVKRQVFQHGRPISNEMILDLRVNHPPLYPDSDRSTQ